MALVGTRVRKVRRDIWSRKMRTLLVSASIFIGVFGVVTLFTTSELLIRQLEADIQQDRLAMNRSVLTLNSSSAVDNEADLAALRAHPGVVAAEGRSVSLLLWRLPGEERFREGRIAAYSAPFDELVLEPPRLVRGDTPQAGQLAVERRMADRYRLEIGDSLEVRILSGGAERSDRYAISGIMFQSYGELAGPGFAEPTGLVFATYDDAQLIAGFAGFSHLYTRFVDYATAQREGGAYQAAIASQTPYVPVFTVIEDPATSPLIENTRTTNQVLVMLAMIALVVSGFLVVNVVNSLIVEQRRQIGVMKSLGASRLDNVLIYAGIAFSYGLIGVIPGVLLGIPGGSAMAQALATQNNTVIEEFGISVSAIVIGVLVGLAVPLLAAIVPVINGTRVTIFEAMTDLGIDAEYGRGWLARLLARLPMPITLRQAVNNVNRKKFRLVLTGTTLTVAVGAFMGIFAVFSSLSGVIDDIFGAFGSHMSIEPKQGQTLETVRGLVDTPELAAALEAQSLPALVAIEPASSLSLEIEGYDPPPVTGGPPGIFSVGFNTENPELTDLNLRSGVDWEDDPSRDGIVISTRIADLMGKEPGDRLVLMAGGGRDTFEIIGVVHYPFDAIWMPWEDLARLGGLVMDAPTPDDYAMGAKTVELVGHEGAYPDGQTGILGMTLRPDDEMSRLLSLRAGTLYAPGADEVIISQELAAAGGYDVGDRLTLALNGREQTVTVTGVFELPVQLDANAAHPREVIGMFWEDLARLEGRSLQGEVYPNSFNVILSGDPDAATADAVTELISEALLSGGITAEYTNWVAFQDTIIQFVRVFNIILYMAAGLIAAVGALGLLTSLSMSVFERQKEIGVMRSVGATSRTVTAQFLVEGLTVGVVAWLFGIPLGYVLAQMLISALPFERFGVGFPPVTVLYGLAGMLVVVTIASLWPSLAAARKTVSDILRYQ